MSIEAIERLILQGCYPDIWIRLPVRGTCPYTGLSRAHYYQLINTGAIKTANLKKPGKLTGVRLVWLPSVLAYIEKHVETRGDVS